MKIDIHVHSKYSKDSLLDLKILRKIYVKKNIIPVITDHNTIEGNKKFKCEILGEEIKTKEGEIIGLFMTEEVKPFLTLEETLDILKKQDALVMVPHPFDNIRKSTLKKEIIPEIIEVFNSRTIKKESNKKALDFANKNKILKLVGSDAHTRIEIGNAYNVIEGFNSKKEFLDNLKKAEFFCKRSPLIVHPYKKLIRLIKLFYKPM